MRVRRLFGAAFGLFLFCQPPLIAQQYKPLVDDEAIRPAPDILEDCVACHTLEEGGETRLGPNLHNLYGRDIASVADYAYSDALMGRVGVWDEATLMGFLERPDYFAAGTQMHFKGIAKFAERRRLIEWFKLQRKGINDETALRTLDAVLERGVAGEGRRFAHQCFRCHKFEPGARSTIGPNLYGVVGRPIAALPDFEYSLELQGREGAWTPENLYRFFIERKGLQRGSHFAFTFLDTPLKRAHVIQYLQSVGQSR